MEKKNFYARHISPKKGSWLKSKLEEGFDQNYERTDGKARIYRVASEFTGVVPNIDVDGALSYVNLGPFLTLKQARRAVDTYLHDHGFVIYREDVVKARARLSNGNV
jgi:hypothetical protein